jgi:hypothetical protein
MNTYRKNAITAGVLLLIGFAGVVTMVTYGPILNSQDYLARLAANENSVLAGAVFYLIMALACGGIAIALYPVLRKHSEGLALGAAGFRLMETPLQILGVVFVMLLLTLSHEFVKAGAPAASHFQTTGAFLLAGYDWVGNVAITLPWAIGAAMYHWIFYKTKLIPRWLAGWGLIGVPVALAGCILLTVGAIKTSDALATVLNLPLGVQEIPLALWLIIKGFNPKALAALQAKQA